MTADPVIDHFVAPMRRRFTIPAGIDQNGFLADLAEALEAFSPAQLDSAARHFRDHRDERSFPTISVCRKACESAPTERQIQTGKAYIESQQERASHERREWQRRLAAIRLCRSSLGRQADKGGWLPALLEYATDNQRLPEGAEIERVQAVARRSEDALARARGSSLFANLCAFRKAMLDRAHDDVFGEARASASQSAAA